VITGGGTSALGAGPATLDLAEVFHISAGPSVAAPQYADALARISNARPVQRTPDIPF
jgi:hypothetical protein